MVNENDTRTGAYFHFANRTGTNWQDSTSNWTQAEAEEKALAAARTTDISGELFTYRPLSQLIPTLVLPVIDSKVASGPIAPTALPVELKRLQILWPSSGTPVIQVNDEVQIQVVGLPTRTGFKAGNAIYVSDFVPGSERLVSHEQWGAGRLQVSWTCESISTFRTMLPAAIQIPQ